MTLSPQSPGLSWKCPLQAKHYPITLVSVDTAQVELTSYNFQHREIFYILPISQQEKTRRFQHRQKLDVALAQLRVEDRNRELCVAVEIDTDIKTADVFHCSSNSMQFSISS